MRCSNGTIATHAALYLTTERKAGMAGGGIAFVPLNLPGVSRGKPLNKLGQRALNQGEIYFDDVKIPRSWMLTKSEGYELELERTLTFANSAMATAFTGVARAAYEEALDYSKQRVQGGHSRGRCPGEDQAHAGRAEAVTAPCRAWDAGTP